MSKKLLQFLLIASAVAVSTLTHQQPAAQPEQGTHREILLQNKFVTVQRITLSPDNDGFAYASVNQAGIVSLRFRPGKQDAAAPGGWQFEKASFFSRDAGQMPTKMIVPPSAEAFRLVNIFLNDPPESARFADDAVKLDPKHNEVLLENSRVRVVRIHFAAGESGPIVDKRPRVIVVLTDSHATVTLPDGHSEVRDAKAGSIYFGNPGRQATSNIGSSPLENIVVELKSR